MPLHKTIDIKDIFTPLFKTRFSRDDRPLQSSIQNFGLLNPPRLLNANGKLQVIDGQARIESMRHMGQSQIDCIIYDEKQLDRQQTFIMCLELNHWDRDFNLVEKAFCLKTAEELFGMKKMPNTFFHCVGMKQNIRTIHQYQELLKLPELVQKYTVNNKIAISVILGFLRFPKEDVEKTASQIFILPINQNRLAEILGLLLDISKREGRKPSVILNKALAEVEQEIHAVKKEQLLRQILNRRRNPLYEARLSDFVETVKSLHLNPITKVTSSPFFEDDSIEVHTKLTSQEELDAFIQTLQHKKWKDLFEK